jgi:hypothetical protein
MKLALSLTTATKNTITYGAAVHFKPRTVVFKAEQPSVFYATRSVRSLMESAVLRRFKAWHCETRKKPELKDYTGKYYIGFILALCRKQVTLVELIYQMKWEPGHLISSSVQQSVCLIRVATGNYAGGRPRRIQRIVGLY